MHQLNFMASLVPKKPKKKEIFGKQFASQLTKIKIALTINFKYVKKNNGLDLT